MSDPLPPEIQDAAIIIVEALEDLKTTLDKCRALGAALAVVLHQNDIPDA